MGIIAEAHLSSPDLMLAHTIETVPDVTVETTFHAAVTDSVPSLYYTARGDDFRAFERALEDDPSIVDVSTVETNDSRRLYRVHLSPRPVLVVPQLVELGAVFLRAFSRDGGWQLKIRLPDRETLVAFKGYCDEVGVDFDLLQLYRSTETAVGGGGYGLTDAQRKTLLTAYERGYFDEPRQASLRDIGEELGISSTAVGGRLRRATAALVEELFLTSSDPS